MPSAWPGVTLQISEHVHQRPVQGDLPAALRPPRDLSHGVERKRIDGGVGVGPRSASEVEDPLWSLRRPSPTCRRSALRPPSTAVPQGRAARRRSRSSPSRCLRGASSVRAGSCRSGPAGAACRTRPTRRASRASPHAPTAGTRADRPSGPRQARGKSASTGGRHRSPPSSSHVRSSRAGPEGQWRYRPRTCSSTYVLHRPCAGAEDEERTWRTRRSAAWTVPKDRQNRPVAMRLRVSSSPRRSGTTAVGRSRRTFRRSRPRRSCSPVTVS